MIIRNVKRSRIPPQLVVRAHCHSYAHFVEYDEINGKHYDFHYLALPALCGISEHAIQSTRSADHFTSGIVIIELDGERINRVIPLTRTLDIRTKESFWGESNGR